MMICNAAGVNCQLGNFCCECMTLTHFLAVKYSKYTVLIAGNRNNNETNENKLVGGMEIGFRYWTGNGNGDDLMGLGGNGNSL